MPTQQYALTLLFCSSKGLQCVIRTSHLYYIMLQQNPFTSQNKRLGQESKKYALLNKPTSNHIRHG